MEERIIDDVMGRGIRLKKTKDGYTDVTDELAPETEEEEIVEEISVILPEGQDEERILESSVTPMEADDEELVDLSPEEADRVRAKKEAERILRQETYKKMCDEGEKLLQTQSYKAAELAYEKALQYDELATEASVGYWRAKTADFTDPDVLVEEYLEEGMEELEYDLGVLAVETIKKEFHANFEKRYEECIEIANVGWEVSIRERYSGQLGGILSVLGSAYYEKGKVEDSKRCFYQAYYMYMAMQDKSNIKLAAKNLKDFFDIEV